MNDHTPSASDATQLQFDEAEYAGPTSGEPTCVVCQQTLPNQYFQVNGAILCEPCRNVVEAQLTGGSSLSRFFKAGLYGFGAAVAGFAIYFGVLKLTGMEIGLISILVGFMVGGAVRKGSEGRGGLLYQSTAVFLTYLAIAVSYSALLIPAMLEQFKAEAAAAAQPKDAAAQPKDDAAQSPDAATQPPAAAAEVPEAMPPEPEPQNAATPLNFVIAVVLLGAFMLALPIIAGFSQPIGLLIVAFALWEAFKLNRKVEVVITGPHDVGPEPERAAAHA